MCLPSACMRFGAFPRSESWVSLRCLFGDINFLCEIYSAFKDLSRNNITVVSDDNFKGQQNLLELNLAKNKMDQIPSGTFKYLTVSWLNSLFCFSLWRLQVYEKLEENINLQDIELMESKTKSFQTFFSIVKLYLSIKSRDFLTYVIKLQNVDKASLLFRPQDLRTLNLADNSLEDLAPKIFQMLTKLKSLDLSRNPLEDLHPDVFKDIIVSFHFTLALA